jgi:hypothetical protein
MLIILTKKKMKALVSVLLIISASALSLQHEALETVPVGKALDI